MLKILKILGNIVFSIFYFVKGVFFFLIGFFVIGFMRDDENILDIYISM